MGGNGLALLHIAELGTTAEGAYIAVEDVSGDIALNRFGCIDTTAVECIDIGIVYLPTYITANGFLTGTSHFLEIATADIALGIVVTNSRILVVGAGEVQMGNFTASHRDRHMGRGLATVTMGTQSEFVNPDIAAHMDIDGSTIHCRTLSRYKLVEDTAQQNQRTRTLVGKVFVLHLIGICQCCIGNLEPAPWSEDGEIVKDF